jgi:putative (di)nucleoside polyphosphate hydrolase
VATRFRAGVGAVVLDDAGRALTFERVGIPDAWQLPQGGLEDGETPQQALWRELAEETGLTQADLVLLGEVPEWLGYELPPSMRSRKSGAGQVQKWFVLRSRTPEPPVRFDRSGTPEFSAWRWVPLHELAADAVAFRRPVYRRLAEFVTSSAPGWPSAMG